jgi:predicted Zn-dependent protease
MLVEQGRFAEVIEQAARAYKLEPKSVAIRANLATVLMFAGREKHAADEARDALRLDPMASVMRGTVGRTLRSMCCVGSRSCLSKTHGLMHEH